MLRFLGTCLDRPLKQLLIGYLRQDYTCTSFLSLCLVTQLNVIAYHQYFNLTLFFLCQSPSSSTESNSDFNKSNVGSSSSNVTESYSPLNTLGRLINSLGTALVGGAEVEDTSSEPLEFNANHKNQEKVYRFNTLKYDFF